MSAVFAHEDEDVLSLSALGGPVADSQHLLK